VVCVGAAIFSKAAVPGQLPLQRCRSHSTAGQATETENAEALPGDPTPDKESQSVGGYIDYRGGAELIARRSSRGRPTLGRE
jgi:hypothetical protein